MNKENMIKGTAIFLVVVMLTALSGCTEGKETLTTTPTISPEPTTTPPATTTVPPTTAPATTSPPATTPPPTLTPYPPIPMPTPTTPPPTPAYRGKTKTYTNVKYTFSFKYPMDWIPTENFNELEVLLAGPLVQGESFAINININIIEFEKETDFKSFFDTVEVMIWANPDISLRKKYEYDITVSDQTAKVLILDGLLYREGKYICSLREACAIFIKDNFGYVVIYDVPKEYHEEYVDCFWLVINSFEFD